MTIPADAKGLLIGVRCAMCNAQLSGVVPLGYGGVNWTCDNCGANVTVTVSGLSTVPFMSPEQIKKRVFSEKLDEYDNPARLIPVKESDAI